MKKKHVVYIILLVTAFETKHLNPVYLRLCFIHILIHYVRKGLREKSQQPQNTSQKSVARNHQPASTKLFDRKQSALQNFIKISSNLQTK
jgi:hypothetical protein